MPKQPPPPAGELPDIVNFKTIIAEHIQAQAFELVDDEGAVRGGLSLDPESGQPLLTLHAPDLDSGNEIALGLSDEGQPYICLADSAWIGRLMIALDRFNNPAIELRRADGTAVMSLCLDPNGCPETLYWSPDGQLSSRLRFLGPGYPTFELLDQTNRLLGAVIVDRNSNVRYVPAGELGGAGREPRVPKPRSPLKLKPRRTDRPAAPDAGDNSQPPDPT